MFPTSRLRLETLEDRATPAVTAGVTNGVLNVTGAATGPTGTIKLMVGANSSVRVFDSGALVGTFTAPSEVRVTTGDAADKVEIDFGGNNLTPATYAGQVLVDVGAGNDTVKVANGGAGNLRVYGQGGNDLITLQNLRTTRGLVLGGGAGTDTVEATELGVFLGSTGTISGVETVNANISTPGNLFVRNYTGVMTATLSGNIGGNLETVSRGGRVTFSRGRVTGELLYQPADMPTTGNELIMLGRVGKVTFLGTNFADRVLIAGEVDGDFSATTRGGNDRVQLGDPELLSQSPTQRIGGVAVADLGDGNDTLTLAPFGMPFPLSTLFVNGSTGTDTFVGDRTRPGLTLVGVEA